MHREQRRAALSRNEIWSLDFATDQLANGRRLRALTLVDLYARECLAIEVGHTLRAEDVVRTLAALRFERGLPQRIYCDNGSEFVSGETDPWAYTDPVALDFSRRGKPTDKSAIESFNGRLRDECLNAHWFESVDDATCKIDAWRWEYNEHRPYRAVERLTPREFARRTMLVGAADSPS